MPVFIKKPSQKEIITDFEQLVKKSVKHKKHLKVVKFLKKLVKATIITKRI